mmetsp:Transcript_41293/g.90085  ORF Transcript_41293/g.90085 Transcript_41293/m.90085 type:complete len:80 (+) Transcript_41293:500-739(+)|eukprot:CAMPEP_0116953886 /NCGR_PEP_ID=MMETSP0467-20121206/41567_1 /TAXON_ID=283647 /ORGANISM="Mesodinium pulex, Strain SPMC105" /LENGTH=79 /DNA_ID=CAMNT_0004639379 /DNA_START=486 /DNA_END=725 /DNA_ORIENTATION=+
MDTNDLSKGLVNYGGKLQNFYTQALQFAKESQKKTDKAKELADKLSEVVLAAEGARASFFNQLDNARDVLAQLKTQALV